MPDRRAASFVSVLGRTDPSVQKDMEVYPWDLPAQYSRLRHVTEATAQPFGGISELGKLPIKYAENVQQCATPYPDASKMVLARSSGYTVGRSQAQSGWIKRPLGPLDSAKDAAMAGTAYSLRDGLGTSLAPGRTFY